MISTSITLFHLGFVLVGLPYSFAGQMSIEEMSSNSPYGVSTITGGKGERMASKNELDGARFQGKWVTEIANKLTK